MLPISTPFTGVKQSGIGCDMGRLGILRYMREGESIQPRSLRGSLARRSRCLNPPRTARNAAYVNFAPLRTVGWRAIGAV